MVKRCSCLNPKSRGEIKSVAKQEVLDSSMTDVTRERVLARWAYSELASVDHGRKYDVVAGFAELRANLRKGVPFDGLDPKECGLLLAGWEAVRGTGTIFGQLLNGISTFEVQ